MSMLKLVYARRLSRVFLLLIMLTARLPIHVANAASQEFTVPKKVVDESVWKVIWRDTYAGPQRTEKLIYDEFLIQLFKANSTLNPQEAVNTITELRQKYEAAIAHSKDPSYRLLKSYDEIVRVLFDIAIDMPSLAATVKVAWLTMVNQTISPQLDSATAIVADTQRFELPDNIRNREETILQEALDLAKQNPQFAEAYDQLSGTALTASIKSIDATRLLQTHPAIYVPPQIRDNILPDGSIRISLQALKDLSQIEFNKLNATLTDLRTTINTIDSNQTKFLDYMNDQKKREQMQTLAKAKAAEDKLDLDARKSAISILSTFVGLSDATLGKNINTILTSYTQVGDALDEWLTAVAGLDTLNAIGSMSTIVMTGNVLGAVMNIVNLFSAASPTKDDLILKGIGDLRKQIEGLGKDMKHRFDQVDKELNTIFTTMQDRFNRIDLQLGQINDNVQEIQRALIGISLTLSRIEHSNFEFLDAAHRRPLLNAINGAIGYQARTGTSMPFQPDFVDNENIFQTWGTIHAFDPLSAGPTQRNFNDDQVLAELNAYPLDMNINYLNGWLIAHGLTPFASDRLASPRDWTFASRAYAQMTLDWPEHAKRISPDRQAALDRVGVNLDTATHHIATIDTPAGPQGNKPLYTGVVDYYKGKLIALDAGIQSQEVAFVQEVRANRIQRAEPFDLFGGIDQSLTYQSPQFNQMNCGDPIHNPSVPAPSNLKAVVPGINRYILAEYLKLGQAPTLKVCLSGALINEREVCTPKLGCVTKFDFQVTVDVRFQEVLIASRSLIAIPTHAQVTDPIVEARILWQQSSFRTKFDTKATDDIPSNELKAHRAALLAATTADLQKQFVDYQRELYGRVLNEMLSGSLHPVTDELTGGAILLNDFTTLGLPRAVTNDDLMRSLLFGSQRVLDDSLVGEAYAISVSQPVTQVQIMTDTRVALNQLGNQRITALNDLLNEYLDAIGTDTHVEEFNLVANARLELRLAQRLAKLSPVDAQKRFVVFLPALQR